MNYKEMTLPEQACLRANLAKTTGTAQFVSDLHLPGMLEGVILRAPVARCRIKKLDTSSAREMDGVRAIVTGADIRGAKRIGKTVLDQDFLCETETYGIYDAIALIAADTKEHAKKAAQAIQLDYEELPAVFTLEEAMKPDAVLARPDIRPDSNLLCAYHFSKGEADAAYEAASVKIEKSFSLSPIEHCYLETDIAIADYKASEGLDVWLGCHEVAGEKSILMELMQLPEDRIRVYEPYMGGSFGGKDDGLIAGYAALLSRAAEKPVRLWIARNEEMPFHTKRHGQNITLKMGFDRQGHIEAAKYEVKLDTGSSSHHGENILKFISVNVCGPYTMSHVKVDSEIYYTNGMAMGAMRSWGMPGITFANEVVLNMAAEELGIDPLEIRKRNGVKDGDYTFSLSEIPPDARYLETLDMMARKPLCGDAAEKSSGRFRYGVGFSSGAQGCNLHFGHPDHSFVRLRVGKNGHLYIETAANDLGQGLEVALSLIVARELSYPLEKIFYARPSSDYPIGGPTGASRQTTLTGNATLDAAKKLIALVVEKNGSLPEDLEGWLVKYGEGLAVIGTHTAPATSAPDETGKGKPVNQYSYGTQRAEVLVDTLTGAVKLQKIQAVLDIGKVLNPNGAEGQAQGAISQGIGMALMEEVLQQRGLPLQGGFSQYLFPTIADTPPIEVDFIDLPVRDGALQVKGMAELSTTFTAPAIISAIHDAVGVWVCDLPATPEKVLRALEEKDASDLKGIRS